MTWDGPDGSKGLGTQAESTWLQDGEQIEIPARTQQITAEHPCPVPWGFRKLLGWIHNRYKMPICE